MRVAITGPRGQGKSGLLLELAKKLSEAEVSVAGVIQPVVYQAGVRRGYDLVCPASGHRRSLARRRPGDEFGFDFDEGAFAWASERILAARQARVGMVDELGLLEMKGGGHLPAVLQASLPPTADLWVFAVRYELADHFRWQLGFARIYDLAHDACGDVLGGIMERVLRWMPGSRG